MNYKLLALALILTACSASTQQPQSTPAQVMAAGTPTPAQAYPATPDVGALQGELYAERQKLADAENIVNAKQAEIDRLERQRLEFTVTAEYNKSVEADRTQSAYSTNVAGTQISIPITQTAFPVVATIQAQNSKDRAAELQAQEDYARQLRERVAAEAYQGTWQYYEALKMALYFFCICLVIVLIVRFIVGTLYKWMLIEQAQRETPAPIVDLNAAEEKEPMHFVPVNGNPNQLKATQTEIPCPLEILLFIADEITANKKTFGIGQWVGTQAHKVMVRGYFRLWALHEDMIIEVPGKNGEVMIVEKGQMFFEDTSELREPPLPYHCPPPSGEDAPNNPPIASQA